MNRSGFAGAGISRIAAVAAAASFIACAGDPAAPGPPQDAVLLASQEVVSIQESWSGYGSIVRTVITTPQAWAEAWATLYSAVTPQPSRPDIDFAANVVVLAAMGTRPSGGHSVTIEEVRAHMGALYVAVRERSPGPACGTTGALTAPVHAVQVPREATAAFFTVTKETYAC